MTDQTRALAAQIAKKLEIKEIFGFESEQKMHDNFKSVNMNADFETQTKRFVK